MMMMRRRTRRKSMSRRRRSRRCPSLITHQDVENADDSDESVRTAASYRMPAVMRMLKRLGCAGHFIVAAHVVSFVFSQQSAKAASMRPRKASRAVISRKTQRPQVENKTWCFL